MADINQSIAADAVMPGAGLVNQVFGGLFGGGDKKRIYPAIKFNADGSVIPGKNIDQNKNYRKAANLATSFQNFLPALTLANNKANAATALSDTQTQLDLLKQFGADYANQNVGLNRIEQLGQGETNLQLQELQKLADPEFFKLRELIGQKSAELLGGMDPNKLTEGEIANVERIGNRNNIGQGTAGTGSPLASIKNALRFDDRLSAKKNSLAQTLSAIGNIAPNLKSGTFNNMTGGNSGGGQSQGQIGGAFSGANNSNLAGNLMNQNTSNMQATAAINANKVAPWEKVAGAIPDY